MKKRYVVLVILLIILGGGAYLWQLQVTQIAQKVVAKENKSAQLEKILDRKVKVEKKDVTSTKYEGKYFSLSYPGDLTIKKNETNPEAGEGGTLENLFLLKSEPRLNLVVLVTGGGGNSSLEDFPALKLRNSQTEIYKKEPDLELKNIKAVIYSKLKDGTEKTAFFVFKGNIYSLSVTGYNKDEVGEFFDQTVKSLELK